MKRLLLTPLVLGLTLAAVPFPALAADPTPEEAQTLVADSGKTLDAFAGDSDMSWFRAHAKDSKGLFICSQVTKAGFVFGGSGGRCVLVVKSEKGWNGPAFYAIGTASVGFQAGVSVAEVVMMVMTRKALDSLMSSAFKLGGEASIAIGPIGAGAAATPKGDLIIFSRAKGVYGGLNATGAKIKPSEDFNKVYYSKDVSPIDIIARGEVHNPAADSVLLSKVAKLYSPK